MKFEWDENKDKENYRKHGIRFEQVIPAFYDDHALYYEDDTAAYGEQRMILLGASQDRVLLIVYVEIEGDSIRLISARKAESPEIRTYRRGHR